MTNGWLMKINSKLGSNTVIFKTKQENANITIKTSVPLVFTYKLHYR